MRHKKHNGSCYIVQQVIRCIAYGVAYLGGLKLNISKAVKIIMLEKGVNGVDLARVLGINRTTIMRNVGDGSNPTIKTLEKYADALDVKVSDIVSRAERLK